MALSSATDRHRHPAALLLSSFPAPPSHIPPSPLGSYPSSPLFPSSPAHERPHLSPLLGALANGAYPPSPLGSHPPSPAHERPHLTPLCTSPANPPPSRPPSLPLPPVPGPSPIGPAEQLALLARTSTHRISRHSGSVSGAFAPASPLAAGARPGFGSEASRRTSLASTASGHSNATSSSGSGASAGSVPALTTSTSPSTSSRPGSVASVASLRSVPSSGSLRRALAGPPGAAAGIGLGFSLSKSECILEASEDTGPAGDDEDRPRPPQASFSRTDDGHVGTASWGEGGTRGPLTTAPVPAPAPPAMSDSEPQPHRARARRHHHGANDSISEIDMRDLPVFDDDIDEDGALSRRRAGGAPSSVSALTATVTPQERGRTTASRDAAGEQTADGGDVDADADAHARALKLHLEMRAARSKSRSHQQRLRREREQLDAPSPVPSLAASATTATASAGDAYFAARAGSSMSGASTATNGHARAPSFASSTTSIADVYAFLDHDHTITGANGKNNTANANGRAGSPDISTILSTTPRPRRKASSSALSSASALGTASARSSLRASASGAPPSAFTDTPRARTTGRARSSSNLSAQARAKAGVSGREDMRRRVSEGIKRSRSRAASAAGLAYEDSDEDGEGEEVDYGVVLGRGGEAMSVDEFGVMGAGAVMGAGTVNGTAAGSVSGKKARVLEDEGGSDSDSSIDVHTPLPHLMFRDGLLSPRSKLFAQTRTAAPPFAVPDDTPDVGGRPGSVLSAMSNMSEGSIMTKSGIFKDERDTVRRRTRHRDGHLLRGGIGLTTGLGWSDSEDEDAPSPLTRHLSAQTISRQASATSLPARPPSSAAMASRSMSSLSRSHSAGTPIPTASTGSLGSKTPPARRSFPLAGPAAGASAGHMARTTSASSARSMFSVPEHAPVGVSSAHSSGGVPSYGSRARASSASSVSSAGVAPKMKPKPRSTKERAAPIPAANNGAAYADKPLPSPPTSAPAANTLPRKSSSSNLSVRSTSSSGHTQKQMATPRRPTLNTSMSTPAFSASSAGSTPTSSVPGSATSSASGYSSYAYRPAAPRPLHLSQSHSAGHVSAPASTTQQHQSVLGYNRHVAEQQRLGRLSAGSQPGSPASPGSPLGPAGDLRPKPRTGTGMAYRRSSGINAVAVAVPGANGVSLRVRGPTSSLGGSVTGRASPASVRSRSATTPAPVVV